MVIYTILGPKNVSSVRREIIITFVRIYLLYVCRREGIIIILYNIYTIIGGPFLTLYNIFCSHPST